MIAQETSDDFDEVNESIMELINVAKNLSDFEVVSQMKKIVPEYKSLNSEFQMLDIVQ
jgi:hypothetical protein